MRRIHCVLAPILAGAIVLAVASAGAQEWKADVEALRCRVLGTDGALREVDPKDVVDAPDPQNLIFWNARHKTVPVGRLDPGDAVELVTRRVGFTYALLLDGGQPPDESRFVPPMKGQFYDIVPFWSAWPVSEQRYRVTVPLDKHLQYQFFDGAAEVSDWVAENVRYVGLHMGAGEGYTLHPAAMTLRDRGGVCKDKAGILAALLRAAGFESYAATPMTSHGRLRSGSPFASRATRSGSTTAPCC